jgi:hypothetical protein
VVSKQARIRQQRRSHGDRAAGAGTPAVAPTLDDLDWRCFICSSCGEETFVGRDLSQSVEDFALMCDWLYGYPPTCSSCQHRAVA